MYQKCREMFLARRHCYGIEKKVVVTFGKEDKKIRAVRTGQTRGNYNKPEAGDVFTGNCVITAVDGEMDIPYIV